MGTVDELLGLLHQPPMGLSKAPLQEVWVSRLVGAGVDDLFPIFLDVHVESWLALKINLDMYWYKPEGYLKRASCF